MRRRFPRLYLAHYKPAFAFSLILYPPRVYVFVASDLLEVIDLS
jgi:hypothetical protein